MKLAEHTEHIRQLIELAFRNRLGRMGINEGALVDISTIPSEYKVDRARIEVIREVFIAETGSVENAYEKLIEELTFTLFNRLAALKVMEAHTLHPEIVTQREIHGSRSFAHLAWLEQNQNARNEEAEGLVMFFEQQLQKLAGDIPLFNPEHPYHLLPTPLELKNIIIAFNSLETDSQVEPEIWKSDDVLGWLYESYNNYKKAAHKASGEKTEFNKVSIQSQVYTPKWVVKFLVDNSLGKFYLEMYPNSDIKSKYTIANAPVSKTRELKPLHEIKLIDPSNGSGNYLLYAFDLYYDIYLDNINEQGNPNNYDEADIAKLIIEHNLHGVDLDDRAVQLAQLGLYIKAKRKKRTIKIEHFNIVSSDFFLPNYDEVKGIFEENAELGQREKAIVADLWEDLQNAYKFGSLIRLEEKLSLKWFGSKQQSNENQITMFGTENVQDFENFKEHFFIQLQKAVTENTDKQGQTFLNSKTQDAITFLEILSQKYEITVANPPYTDSSDFGAELKYFIDSNYRVPYKFNSNLYSSFIKRACEITTKDGFIGMLHPLTFMYISTYSNVRKYLLSHTTLSILAELGLGGVFENSDVQADVVAYILKNKKENALSHFLDFKKYKNHSNKPDIFKGVYRNLIEGNEDSHIYSLSADELLNVTDSPFIYWISNEFREKFKQSNIGDEFDVVQGLATANNDRFVRFWWEVDNKSISKKINDNRKWHYYSKGGPYSKWYGNNWAIVNWENDGYEIKNFKDEKGKQKSRPQNEKYYKRSGITYTRSGSKGASFRLHSDNYLFDVGGACVFPKANFLNNYYLIAFLNSKLSKYILDCLNPTVNTTEGDMKKIPFVIPDKINEEKISKLAKQNIEIKKEQCSYRIIEHNFAESPLLKRTDPSIIDRIISHVNESNFQDSIVLINEAIINQIVINIYNLSELDLNHVETTMGKSIGDLPIILEAKNAFLYKISDSEADLKNHLNELDIYSNFEEIKKIIDDNFELIYHGNSNLEEFCLKYSINPVNVWYFIQEKKQCPKSTANLFSLEFLVYVIREILFMDEDGIIPLVGLPGEPKLYDRIESYLQSNNLNNAQILQFETLLGKSISNYIENDFFKDFIEHIKLFKQMPSAPFVWHISSGQYQGFDCYTLIYKWNSDTLFKLKSQYVYERIQSLEYRLIQIQDVNTAQAQNEKDLIRLQLIEIGKLTQTLDKLISSGFNYNLDDGVAKNIAPLQLNDLLKFPVLNNTQLKQYLNADW